MLVAPRLRLIQKIGVGLDTIDLQAAEDLGIGVANMPGTNSAAVAEMTLALMLSALRRIPFLDATVRRGETARLSPEELEKSGEIGGRTIGLVGFGEVARRLVAPLNALGARVLYHARREHPDAGAEWRALDDLLAVADIISLHIPLTPDTADLIDVRTFQRMKDGAILINTARGGLVDESALAEALTSGKLRAAGLDVLRTEPPDSRSPLLRMNNVVIAPHVSWLTPETIGRSLAVAFENGRRALAGEQLLHEVRPVRRPFR